MSPTHDTSEYSGLPILHPDGRPWYVLSLCHDVLNYRLGLLYQSKISFIKQVQNILSKNFLFKGC